MASATVCRIAPAATSSSRVDRKVESVSPSDTSSLRSERDFRRVLKRGKRKQAGGVTVVAAEGTDGPPRVGFIVSRSVGNAVARNRARRRLRHTVYDVTLQPGMDYVIIARDSVIDAPYPTLKGWLERALAGVESKTSEHNHA